MMEKIYQDFFNELDKYKDDIPCVETLFDHAAYAKKVITEAKVAYPSAAMLSSITMTARSPFGIKPDKHDPLTKEKTA